MASVRGGVRGRRRLRCHRGLHGRWRVVQRGAAREPARRRAPPRRPPGQPSRGGSPAAQPAGAPTTGSPAAACVTQVLGNLTLAQRVGQLFLVGVDGNIAGPELTAAERTYHFGSLLLNKTGAGTAALAAQTAAMQELAPSGTGGVRFFIAANQEGGQIQQLSGPGFATMPSELVQGSWALSTLRAAATDWGTDLRAAGVNLDLAPVMDVVPQGTAASNAPIGALDREFGFDPVTNGAARDRLHPGDGRGRGHDRGQALPRPRPGGGEHRLHVQRRRQRHDGE